jgi:protein-disulfide isomerase
MSKKEKQPTQASIRKAAEEARDRKIKNILIAVSIVTLLIIAAMTAIAMQGKPRSATPNVNASAPRPAGAFDATSPYAFGVPYGSNPDAPVMELFEDFQCPACKALEDANGKGIIQLADEGKVLLVYRPVNFLDNGLGNTASTRAANAFGCAVDAGVGQLYHDLTFANQPRSEGTGYTDANLESFAVAADLTGSKLDAWKACVANRTYYDWIANSMNEFNKEKLTGTPTVRFQGKIVDNMVVATPDKLNELVANAK